LLGYCETMQCRRQVLLAGFGEVYATACGNCDNCLHPVTGWDATVAAQKALSCVYRSGQRYGVTHLIDVLRGGETERVKQLGHDHLSTYGVGKDLDAKTWRSVFRQLVAGGLLQVDGDGYGSLHLTPASRAVLTGGQKLMLRREQPTTRRERDAPGSIVVAPQDMGLFQALRELRGRLAKEQNVPAYVIFHDSTLRTIAEQRPQDLRSLGRLGGIGGSKLERYGEAVIDVVQQAG